MKKIIFLLLAVCLTTTAISQNKRHNAKPKPKRFQFNDVMVSEKSAATKPKATTKAKEKIKDKRKND
jgi:hypothetical protein